MLSLAYLASCGIGFMMFGYDQAVLGVLSTQPGFLAAIGVSTFIHITHKARHLTRSIDH